MVKHWSEVGEIIGCHVFDPEYGVRVANVGHRRLVQDRFIDRANLQFDRTRVGKSLRERNVTPAESRGPHIDADPLRAGHLDVETACPRLEYEGAPSRLFRFKPANATHAIAAGFGLRTVGIKDADVGLSSGAHGFEKHHHLVEVRQWLVGNGDYGRWAKIERSAPAQVDDQDLVAETAHLLEWETGGHAPLYGQRGSKTIKPALALEIGRNWGWRGRPQQCTLEEAE